MIGKVTKASVEEWVKERRDLIPMQIDGIPEGFSFWMDKSVQIGKVFHKGYLVSCTPGYNWDRLGATSFIPVIVDAIATDLEIETELSKQKKKLLNLYKENIKHRDGK